MSCRVCSKDLTAKPETVPSALRPGSKTTALRAPERVEIIFSFAGFKPARPEFRVTLCASCMERVTYAATGVSFVIDAAAHPLDPDKKGMP
jgi:hypothetical protein